jgi:diguanylate cyclase (GGDEF)-like protein
LTEKLGQVSVIEETNLDDVLNENRALKARIIALERQVARDGLTNLYNRQHFMAELDRWTWRVRRYGGQYGLLFIDVDDLKPINDVHGHGAGDAVLIAIGDALISNTRKSDIAARIGGDEYGVLLDTISPDNIAGRATRIIEAVRKLKIPYRAQILTTQVSIGHTLIEPGMKPADLLLRADKSMYKSKANKA